MDISRWYVVRTAYGEERRADIAMRTDGFTIFNPSVFRVATAPRRDSAGVMRRGRPEYITSLFPRYFFTQLNLSDPGWHRITRLPGVECLLSGLSVDREAPGAPIAVPDQQIELVRAMCEPNGCIYPPDHLHGSPIDVGTCVRLLSGSMEGHTGICEWSDGKRIKLLMSILGRAVPVVVACASVEAI